MMNVLLDNAIFDLYAGGGVARYFNELIPRVALHDREIRFMLAGDKSALSGCVNMRRLEMLNPVQYRPWKLFWKHIHARRVLEFQSSADVFLSTYYAPKPRASMKSVVVVYDCIDASLPCMNPNGPAFVGTQRKVMEEADAVIAISEETKRGILQYTRVKESRIKVIYPIAGDSFMKPAGDRSIREFREAYGVSKPYWLFVGTRGYYKNFDGMLRAFSMLARDADSELVVVGGEKELTPHLLDYVFRKRLEHRVHLVGRLTDESLSAAYTGAEGFVYPSFAEGFGIPLLEAMQCGVPVVASDIPVFREVAGAAAVYFDPHSAVALAGAMRSLSRKDLREHLRREGALRVKLFAGRCAAEQMADVLRRVSGEGHDE